MLHAASCSIEHLLISMEICRSGITVVRLAMQLVVSCVKIKPMQQMFNAAAGCMHDMTSPIINGY